jgi:hypothetical protein
MGDHDIFPKQSDLSCVFTFEKVKLIPKKSTPHKTSKLNEKSEKEPLPKSTKPEITKMAKTTL